MNEPHRRRASDNIDPDVQLAINDGDADTRHLLRNEFAAGIVTVRADLAAIRQDVQVGNLAQVAESASMKASMEELKHGFADLRSDVDVLQLDVGDLKSKSVAADAVASLKRWVIAAVAIPTVGIVVTGLLYLAAQH